MQLLFLTLRVHQRVQFAGANAGLAHSDCLHKLDEFLILLDASPTDAITFVKGLATDPHKLASPADTQGLGLRNDLPGRFFTTETP